MQTYMLNGRSGRIYYMLRDSREMNWQLQSNLLDLNAEGQKWGPRDEYLNGRAFLWKRLDGEVHATYDKKTRMMTFYAKEYEKVLEDVDDR